MLRQAEAAQARAGRSERLRVVVDALPVMVSAHMYPEVTSMLATRRMASSNPNGMQLAKRGESTYVRGFYEPDTEDEVMVSLDWSQVELVLIGEFSGDPEFSKAFGQLP